MKSREGSMIKIRELAEKLSTMIEYSNDPKKFSEGLALTHEVLGDPDLPKSQRQEFEFLKAVLMDGMGECLEALELFLSLKRRYPLSTKYARSVRIVSGSVMEQARRLANENPDAASLRNYYELLQEVSFAPHWLTYIVARQEAIAGKALPAKTKMKALTALSPNDRDYLKNAYQIALISEDKNWQREIEIKIGQLIEEKPYRLELYTAIRTPQSAGDASKTKGGTKAG